MFGWKYVKFNEIYSLPQGIIYDNTCKVDHEMFHYIILVLSETHLFPDFSFLQRNSLYAGW